MLRRSECDQRGRLFVQLERAEFGEIREDMYVPDARWRPWKITSVTGGRAYVERVDGWLAVALRAVFAIMWCWAWLTGEVRRG